MSLKFSQEEADFTVQHEKSRSYVYTFKIVGELHFYYFTNHFDKGHFAEIKITDGKLFFRHDGEPEFRQEDKNDTPDLIDKIVTNYYLIKDVLGG